MKKICSECDEEKDETEFNWKEKSKGKRSSYCRVCHSIKMKEQYNKNKPYYMNKAKKWDNKRHQFIWDYLKLHPCVDCGETDPIVLDFDHKDETQKNFSLSNALVSEDKLLQEIEKCDIRCANCHRRRTALQFGWYKNITK